MKAFVIKNKEGKYCTGEFNENDEYVFTENLVDAEKFYEDIFAQRFCPNDCEVVEITIEEVDNSKREYNETIKYVETTEPDKVADHIDNLEQQLAEKDKKIRKQVCEEVKDVIVCHSVWNEQCYIINMVTEDLLKEIDIIKQPKENM